MRLNVKIHMVIASLGVFLFVFQNCGNELDSSSPASSDVGKVDGVPEEITELDVEEKIHQVFADIDGLDINNDNDKTRLLELCALARLISHKHEFEKLQIVDLFDQENVQIFSTEKLELLENIEAQTLILGRGGLLSSPIIQKIKDFKGNLLICGMTVGVIEGLQGKALIINGGVGDISHLTGHLNLVNSPLMGTTTDIQGKIHSN
ncbi:MAG: hypothetical protein KDD40_02750 [Bdellovibrionales bacterium]|nr:hypothetical protein [Bdellovibrionales bacterium]